MSATKTRVGVAPRPHVKVTFVVKNRVDKHGVRGLQFLGDTLAPAVEVGGTVGPTRGERQWPNNGQTGPSGQVSVNFQVGHVRVLMRVPPGAEVLLPRWANDRSWAVVHDAPLAAGVQTIEVLLDWPPQSKLDWEPVSSSRIFVGKRVGKEQPFVEWFNRFRLMNIDDFPHELNKRGFGDTFDNCVQWGHAALTGREFFAFLMIMYNETGGQLLSQIEPNNDLGFAAVAYCFERRGKKMGYNFAPGNRKAGDQLKNHPSLALTPLTPEQVGLWNGEGTLPPNEPEGVRDAAKDADFWKFRGHGLMQITGRAVFRVCAAQPLGVHFGIAGAATATTELQRDAVLDVLKTAQVDAGFGVPAVVYDSLRRYIDMTGGQTTVVNAGNWEQFGATVSGSLSYGRGIYTRRCQGLLDAMEQDGVRLG